MTLHGQTVTTDNDSAFYKTVTLKCLKWHMMTNSILRLITSLITSVKAFTCIR